MSEKQYKMMSHAGAASVTIGIIMIVVGIVSGIISIVSGVKTLRARKDMIF